MFPRSLSSRMLITSKSKTPKTLLFSSHHTMVQASLPNSNPSDPSSGQIAYFNSIKSLLPKSFHSLLTLEHFCDSTKRTIDIAYINPTEDLRVAIEYDGPWHWATKRGKRAFERFRDVNCRPNKKTEARNLDLESAGWLVVPIRALPEAHDDEAIFEILGDILPLLDPSQLPDKENDAKGTFNIRL